MEIVSLFGFLIGDSISYKSSYLKTILMDLDSMGG